MANGAFERARATKRTKLTLPDVHRALEEYGFEEFIDEINAAVEAAAGSTNQNVAVDED